MWPRILTCGPALFFSHQTSEWHGFPEFPEHPEIHLFMKAQYDFEMILLCFQDDVSGIVIESGKGFLY